MPVEIETHTPSGARAAGSPIVIGLVNNMPDTALHATENQFSGLLREASGGRAVRLRLTSLPELPRSQEALEHIGRNYWPLEEVLSGSLDALIVTGTEPRALVLSEEPYWDRFVELLSFARTHTRASVWSCLAAHAAVLSLDGIERQRLAQKRCGVYEHHILGEHPLLAGVEPPMPMPHSRWNELSAQSLRAAGYTLLSWSRETGADAFVREEQSLLLFFQGHPEYGEHTLFKEYRRDVKRYLRSERENYPSVPRGYFDETATRLLNDFRGLAEAQRREGIMELFPEADVVDTLRHSWKDSAVRVYQNWLDYLAARKSEAPKSIAMARAGSI